MKRRTLFLAMVVIAATAHGQKRISEDVLRRRVDSVVQAAVRADLIPGAVIQIEKDGAVVYSRAYGSSQKYDFHHQLLQPAPSMDTATFLIWPR